MDPDGQRSTRSARKVAWLMVLPAVVVVLVINAAPLVYTTVLTFFRWNLTQASRPPRFVGLDNFTTLLSSAEFIQAAMNTVVLVVVGVGLQTVLGLGIALLLDRPIRGARVWTALLLVPIAMAPAVVGSLFSNFLSDSLGPLNYWLGQVGLPAPAWLADPHWSLVSIILVDVWQWTPFVFLLILAGLRSLPPQVDEAAQVDGASWWQRTRYVTVPMLRPIIAVAILLRAIDAFKTFDLVYLLTFGGPGTSSQTLSFFGYKLGVQFLDIGKAAAVSFIMVQVAAVFVVLYRRRLRGSL